MKARSMFLLMFMLVFCIFAFNGKVCFAADLDTINQSNSSSQAQGSANSGSNGSQDSSSSNASSGTGDSSADSISDYMRNHNAVSSEDMQKAEKLTSPITKIIGNLIGIIMVLTTSLIFLVTALDLMYIAIPFTRSFLNPSGVQSGGVGGMGMGGMGGMHMGGMGGGAQGGSDPNAKKWVSDEAVAALMSSQGSQAQGGGMGGMGMGGMGMGGMGMGGGMANPNQAPAGGKSVITAYFKKRAFFLVMFAIASVLLMSSIFMDCGLNLAELLHKVLNMFNSGISNVDI